MAFSNRILAVAVLSLAATISNAQSATGAAAEELSRLAVVGFNTSIKQEFPSKASCLMFPNSEFAQEAQSALSTNLNKAQLAKVDSFYSSVLGRRWTDDTIGIRATGKEQNFSKEERSRILDIVNAPWYIKAQQDFNSRVKKVGSAKWGAKLEKCG